MRERQRLAGGYADAGLHDVYAGHLLGNGMLDLYPRVHLQEEELVPLDEELDGADVVVADGLGGVDRGLAHPLAHPWVEPRTRALLDELLVPTLDGAVALPEVDRCPVLVAQHLYLDMPRGVKVPLQIHRPVAEVRLALPPGPFEGNFGLRLAVGNGETLATATCDGLHRHRVAVLRGEAGDLLRRGYWPFRAGRDGHTSPRHDTPRLHLAPHRLYSLGVRPDPGQGSLRDGPRESGALGQETIARVHGPGAAPPGHLEQLLYLQVALGG